MKQGPIPQLKILNNTFRSQTENKMPTKIFVLM